MSIKVKVNNIPIQIEDCGSHSIAVITKRTRTWRFLLDHVDVALVTSADSVAITGPDRKTHPYAVLKSGGQGQLLHVAIMGGRSKQLVDHKNGNTLDCRRGNLRHVTRSINCLNRTRSVPSRSGIRGVSETRVGTWEAGVTVDGRHPTLGTYKDVRDAAEAVWLAILAIDPIAADNYLRSLPAAYDAARYEIAKSEAA